MTAEASSDHFDIIVIGAGAAGLTTAALLAKAGKKVLLVEKESRIGGHISPLVLGDYHFDIGARLLMGCNSDGPFGPGSIYSLLSDLDVADRCEFIPIQPLASIHMPGLTIPIWSGRQAFLEGMRQASPTGLENLKPLLDLCKQLYQSSKAVFLVKKPWELLKFSAALPDLLRYRNATLEDVLIRYVPDQRPRLILEGLWPYLGLPPERASFLMWALMMATYIEEGGFFCQGGLYSLADAIATAYIRQGGELLLNCAAAKILVENRAVTGVILANGRQVVAPTIVSTLDPGIVFGGLIEASKTPASYYRKLKAFEISHAGIVISMVTDLDLPALGLGFESIIFDRWDCNQLQRNPTNGQVGCYTLTVTTVADASLAPTGQHLISAFTGLPAEIEYSLQDRRRFGALLFAELKKHVPQLDAHLTLATNDSLQNGFLTHEFGPIYGWAASPQQSGMSRLSQRTPVKGLYLAGQWTRPSQGVMSVILSGTVAAQIITG